MEEKSGQKTELRRGILKERNALSIEQRREWDRQIFKHLIRYDQEAPCFVYLCYANYKSEVSTKEFICRCLEEGRIVFVPKVLPGDRTVSGRKPGSLKKQEDKQADSGKAEAKQAEMEFYRITAWEELKAGYQGILEPEALPERAFSVWLAKAEKEARAHTERLHLRMLLPGAVFDRSGNRIGYGGGFYDRWLAKWEHIHTGSGDTAVLEKIGLAYGIQIAEALPTETFDRKVDDVITEEGKIYCETYHV